MTRRATSLALVIAVSSFASSRALADQPAAPPPASSSAVAPPPAAPPAQAPPVAPPAQPTQAPPAAPPAKAPPAGGYVWPPPAFGPGGVQIISPNELPPGYAPPLGQVFEVAEPDAPPPPPPRRRNDTRMMIGGIFMVAGGIATVITGAYLISSSRERIDIYCDGPVLCAQKDDMTRKIGGGVVMALGALISAAGVPMWIIGSKLVLDERAAGAKKSASAPILRVGPASASLTLPF